MKQRVTCAAVLLFIAAALAVPGEQRLSLLPKLQPGQKLTYIVHCRGEKDVKTESSVVVPLAPAPSQLDAHGLLGIEILDVQQVAGRLAVHARARLLSPASAVKAANPAARKSNFGLPQKDSSEKSVEFTIALDGSAEKIAGLDDLSPDEQQVWQAWMPRFAAAWTIPAQRAKIGDKWNAEQPETASSPVASLVWMLDSTYVRNEPCRAARLSPAGEISPSSGPEDACAVLLTTAKLVQNSSSKDATPEDFKLHELKTMGTAKGANEIITYISLTTGLVVRATENADQRMDVVVAKSDGSNRVHYTVNARNQSEVLLLIETPPTHS